MDFRFSKVRPEGAARVLFGDCVEQIASSTIRPPPLIIHVEKLVVTFAEY